MRWIYEMSGRIRLPNARNLRFIIWATGAVCLGVSAVVWVPKAQPHQAVWPWFLFMAMCVIDDVVNGPREEDDWSELPKVFLLAAIIGFREHPEAALLIAFSSAPLASLIKGQSWTTELTTTAHWVLAAVIGSTVPRVIGYADLTHFIIGLACLIAIYYVMGPLVSSLLQSASTGQSFTKALALNQHLFVPLEIVGVAIGVASFVPPLDDMVLRLAQVAALCTVGVFLGFLVGGRVSNLSAHVGGIPIPWFVGTLPLFVLGGITPSPFSWLLPLLGITVLSAWAFRIRLIGVICAGLGGACNELVRAINGGGMVVDVQALPAPYRQIYSHIGEGSSMYTVAGPDSHLAWLGDRFHLIGVGAVSPGDVLVAVGLVWAIVTLMRRPTPQATRVASVTRAA